MTPNSRPEEISAAEPDRHTFHNYRWVVCALLFFATTINYVDRQILSLLKPILDDEVDLSRRIAQAQLVRDLPGHRAEIDSRRGQLAACEL